MKRYQETLFWIAAPICVYLAGNLILYEIHKNKAIDLAVKSACVGRELDCEELKVDYGPGVLGDIHNFLDFGTDLAITRLKEGKYDREILKRMLGDPENGIEAIRDLA